MYYTTSAAKVKVYFVYSVINAERSELKLLLSHIGNAKMSIGLLRHAASARGPGEKAALQKLGLVHILQRDGLLVDRGRKRIQPDGAAAVELDDAAQHPAVKRIETELVDLEA